MSLLRIAALVLFLFAALASFGWLLDQSAEHALGFIAFGLAAWGTSTFPSPPLGSSA